MTTYRSALLAIAGAVAATGLDEGVAAHYGDPSGEQRSLEEGAGFVDASHRSVVTVVGPDRLRWLNDLLSQRLDDLTAGEGREALLLDPHGHVEQHVRVRDDGGTTWIDGEPGSGPTLVAFLDRMRFLLRVEVADVTAGWAMLVVAGPGAGRVLVDAGLPGAAGWRRDRRWPAYAVDLCLPRERLADVGEALRAAGASPVGTWAFEAVRVAAGEPRLGLDTDERTIPNEVGWVRSAVDLHKGCYRGQETVARVHALGRPPRRLVLLHLDGSSQDLPLPGAEVLAGERRVGFVGTAVRHREQGQIALAVLRRDAVGEARLTVALPEEAPATAAVDPDWLVAEELPGEGAGRRAQQSLRGRPAR